jgi:hypothetical protein
MRSFLIRREAENNDIVTGSIHADARAARKKYPADCGPSPDYVYKRKHSGSGIGRPGYSDELVLRKEP